MPGRRWRVGELATAAGVTVRALHHYEETGLLTSVRRTSGDHRVYDEAGVERLYRICVLRGLGLSLEEIRKTMDDGAALSDVLRMHLARVESEVDRLTSLRDRLRSLTSRDAHVGPDDLLATLDAMSRVARHAHARRRRSATRAESAESAWRTAGEELRACMQAGEDPSGVRARATAAKVRAMMEAFAGGDPSILQALARMRAVDPPRSLAGWDPELTRYLDRALSALDKE